MLAGIVRAYEQQWNLTSFLNMLYYSGNEFYSHFGAASLGLIRTWYAQIQHIMLASATLCFKTSSSRAVSSLYYKPGSLCSHSFVQDVINQVRIKLVKNFAPGLLNNSESKVSGWGARVSHCNDFSHCPYACKSWCQTSFYLENSRVTQYDSAWECVTCSTLSCSSFCNLIHGTKMQQLWHL